MGLLDLPDCLLEDIYARIPVGAICALACTCTRLHAAAAALQAEGSGPAAENAIYRWRRRAHTTAALADGTWRDGLLWAAAAATTAPKATASHVAAFASPKPPPFAAPASPAPSRGLSVNPVLALDPWHSAPSPSSARSAVPHPTAATRQQHTVAQAALVHQPAPTHGNTTNPAPAPAPASVTAPALPRAARPPCQVDYSAFFNPQPHVLAGAQALACDGRLTLLAGAGRVCAALAVHVAPRYGAHEAAADPEAAGWQDPGLGPVRGLPLPPARVRQLQLPPATAAAGVWLAPELPAASAAAAGGGAGGSSGAGVAGGGAGSGFAHLSAAHWPQPPVRVPRQPPPPLRLGAEDEGGGGVASEWPRGGAPAVELHGAEGSSVQQGLRPSKTKAEEWGGWRERQQEQQEQGQGGGGSGSGAAGGGVAPWCGWCGSALDGCGLCAWGCGGDALALPAHPVSAAFTRQAEELLSLYAQPPTAPAASPPAGPPPPHQHYPAAAVASNAPPHRSYPAAAVIASSCSSDGSSCCHLVGRMEPRGRAEGRAPGRLTYVDVSGHTQAARTDDGLEALPALLRVQGGSIRHLLAAGSCAVGLEALHLLQGSCGRLVSLDLSAPPGCPPVYGKHPNRSNRHGYDEKHKTQRRLDRDRDSERGNLTARSGDSPKAARSGRPGAKSTARDQAREQGRGQGPGREQGEEVEAGGLAEMMMSTAAAVYGRAVCKAIAGLPHLQVLRLRDMDLSHVFNDATLAPAPANPSTSTSPPAPPPPPSVRSSHPPPPLPLPSLGPTLSRLTHLDIEGSSGVGRKQLASLLTHATQLTHLSLARCRDLATPLHHQDDDQEDSPGCHHAGHWPFAPTKPSCTPGSSQPQSDASHTATAIAATTAPLSLPLRRLSLGWGFDAPALLRLLPLGPPPAPGPALASPVAPTSSPGPMAFPLGLGHGVGVTPAAVLVSLELGAGVTLTDGGLAAVAARCPWLQRLRLEGCGVSGEGVGAALAACRMLHELQVINCSGPFHRQDLLGPLGWLPTLDGHAGGAASPVKRDTCGTAGLGAAGDFVSAVSTASCGGGERGCGEVSRQEQEQQQPWGAAGAQGGAGSGVVATAAAVAAAPATAAAAVAAAPATAAAAVAAAAPVARRWAMSDLRLCGGPYDLYDNDLLSLLYGRPYDGVSLYDGPCDRVAGPAQTAAAAAEGSRPGDSCSTSTAAHSHGVTRVDQEAAAPQDAAVPHAPLSANDDRHGSSTGSRTAPCPPRPPPSSSPGLSLPRLHTLALVGLPCLSYGLLTHMAHYGTALRNVRLEGCGYLGAGARRAPAPGTAATPPANAASSPAAAATGTAFGVDAGKAATGTDAADGNGGGGGGQQDPKDYLQQPQHEEEPGAPWCSTALLGWLARCPRLTNLRLRHCCQLGPDVVEVLVACCPLLQQLLLDGCDLPPQGFKAGGPGAQHGALGYAMVARCQADPGRVSVGSGGGRCCWWLPVERDVKVIRFADGVVTKTHMPGGGPAGTAPGSLANAWWL